MKSKTTVYNNQGHFERDLEELEEMKSEDGGYRSNEDEEHMENEDS